MTDEQIRAVIAQARGIPIPMSADPLKAATDIQRMWADMAMTALAATSDKGQFRSFMHAGLAMLLTDFKEAVLTEAKDAAS